MASNEAVAPAGAPSSPVPEAKQQQQQQEGITPTHPRQRPKLPRRYLLAGPRARYLEEGVPLYEASIKCDWDAAEPILKAKQDLVRYSITENGETALHVAASAKVPKLGVVFVKKLVDMMKEEDLELENENFNTALYLAAAAGNLETVEIMVKKNRNLVTIPGAGRQMLPLYAAALFGNNDVVEFLYGESNELCEADGWNDKNRGWLLEKCIENDMLDIALKIVKIYPQLGSGNALALLAQKTEAFRETRPTIKERVVNLSKYLHSKIFSTNQPSGNKHSKPGSVGAPDISDQKTQASSKKKPNIIWRTINSGKNLYSLMFVMHQLSGNKRPKPGNGGAPEDLDGMAKVSNETKAIVTGKTNKSVYAVGVGGSKVKAPACESIALQLLRMIWKDIAKKPKNEIDRILRGPADVNKQDKSAPGRAVQFMQLQKSISDHIYRLGDITRQQLNTLLLKNLISESLVKMHVETQNIIKGAPDSISQDNKPISGKADQALELQKIISKSIVNMHDEIQKINEITVKEDQEAIQLRLQNAISDHIGKLKTESQKIIRRPAKQTYSSRVVFIAAEMGNTNFLIELIRLYPDLIWKVNDNNQTIFHIAVKHRNAGIYNLLYEIGAMKDMITPLRDPKENNMLHLVGQRAKENQLKDVSGVAFQMQRELLWFKEVRNMIPPSYRERKNEDGLTPHELFTNEHKDLVLKGEEWMKGTASQCMVVAALIATIVFAAAFTVPGGYHQDNGIPVFHSKATFIVFVVADAISLFSSTASILIFLAILTSRYAERDYYESLPRKLMFGLLTLFLSITTMTVAFSVSFFVLYHKGLIWIPILIGVFAVLPVILYMLLQYSLFFDVIRSTYRSRYLFKPKKQVLYYSNPKV
uniref:uncharacterized protein LOC122594311 n=1 Tax=Erigeron canadensis TaxID=72917 RepID=UPI001CB8A0C6|nr:uncharacterized protein LOC122594311 [Erigeron canadensis]XP_043622723.1 uncharacterized protein LOC122594311 [Erigeron canadensis]